MLWFILMVQVFAIQAETDVTLTNSESTQSSKIEENTSSVYVTDEFKSLGHGVSSGKIMVMGNNTFQIPNFHFDGIAPTAYFMVGKGDSVSGNGTRVYPGGSTTPLTAYDGQFVELTLPDDLTVNDVDWLAVWCEKYSQNLGYVFVHTKLFPNSPQTSNFNNEVTSGPVILVNKKLLFVPNFSYNGDYKDVHFWVGNGSEPSTEGIPIPDENGSLGNLHSYKGQDIYIDLPGDTTTDNIEYFGVWSEDEQISLGYVPIKGIEGVPNFTMWLPKCCSKNSVLTVAGCNEESSATFLPKFKVYEHNKTHFSNESVDVSLIDFQPYRFVPDCKFGKYALDEKFEEEFALLTNGSLLVKSAVLSGILSKDQFCVDNVEYDDKTSAMGIFVCAPEHKIQKAMSVVYVIFTIMSTFCFAITFFVYLLCLNLEDAENERFCERFCTAHAFKMMLTQSKNETIHEKCFIAYSFTMMVTFLSLTIVQTANVENEGCAVLGFFFQIFMIASFTLLGILCADIFIIIKNNRESKYPRRKYWYLGVTLGVPLIFLIISLARNLTPDVPNSFFKPHYFRNNCYFEAENQRTIIFYVPIAISILTSIGCLVLTKLQIVEKDRDIQNDMDFTNDSDNMWIREGTRYKFRFRQCFLTSVIMVVSWISNVLMSFLDETNGIFNAAIIFESLQGIFIVSVFTANHYGSIYLNKPRRPKSGNSEGISLNQTNHTDEHDANGTILQPST